MLASEQTRVSASTPVKYSVTDRSGGSARLRAGPDDVLPLPETKSPIVRTVDLILTYLLHGAESFLRS